MSFEDLTTTSDSLFNEENTNEPSLDNYGDYNPINMDIDSNTDEEGDEEYAYSETFRPLESHNRHYYRSSSERSRGFSPLGFRFTSPRRLGSNNNIINHYNRNSNSSNNSSNNSNNSSNHSNNNNHTLTMSPLLKNNSEVIARAGNGDSSEKSEQYRIQPCSFLKSGLSFLGAQNSMTTHPTHRKEWEVQVTIQYVDYKAGMAIGLMSALNMPSSSDKIVTYWEGEIIDMVNHSFCTNKWQATPDVDIQHWKKFEAFRRIDIKGILRGTCYRSNWFQQVSEKYIFMRWKEQCFINIASQDSDLTIAGFYYICIRRSDGAIEGYYYDPDSAPYQKLSLKPQGNGISFSEFSFH